MDRHKEEQKNIAMQYRSKKGCFFWRVGVCGILTVLRGPAGVCGREVGGEGGIAAGVWRREDSPRLRVFLSNNNVIRIIHPRIPVTEESLSVNPGGAKPQTA